MDLVQAQDGTRSTPLRPALASAAAALTAAGLPSPRTDAELLAAHVLAVPRGRLPLVDWFDATQASRYEELVVRRAAGAPLQHLTGTAGFRYLDLAVGPGVFVPRPETELLVEAGLRALAGVEAPVVVDLCAGSGAVGLSVAHEHPGAIVYLVERDPVALEWLRRNATGHQVTVVAGDAADPELPDVLAAAAGRPLLGGARAVLSNPPYIPLGTRLPRDVSGDPEPALYGGSDGLSVLRPLVARAAELLAPGGFVGVEHDDTHGTAVPELFRADGRFTDIADHPDLARRPRYTTGVRC